MISMMLIHACSYYLKTKGIFLIWNSLQWAVPVFLFCSFYIALKNNKSVDYIKRLKRLFIPYWIFLLVYFILLYFFEIKNFNFQYLTANIFLYKGIDFNWLVLLFFYLTFLVPIFKLIQKNKLINYGYFGLSLFSSILFIFIKPISYRFIMWLPWSLFIYFADFIINNEKNNKKMNILGIFSFFIFLFLFFLEKSIGHNISQFANKYPPTLFHLSFGMFSTVIIYKLSKRGLFNNEVLKKILNFFSINSYPLYFIHIIILLVFGWLGLIKQLNWFSFFLIIVGLSSGILMLLRSSQTFLLHLTNRS